MEYETIVWDGSYYLYVQDGTSYTEVMESEGVSEGERSGCSYGANGDSNGGWSPWSHVSTSQRTCVLTIVVDKLLQVGG